MIKMAIVGCGGIGTNGWALALCDFRDQVQVVAAVDVDISRAEKVASMFPGCRAEAEYQNAIPEVDAALLILPHHLHHPIAMDFLRAGKHVLVEKPMANTEAQCLEMIEESERRGLVLMVGYVLRYHPLFLKLKEAIQSKRFGEIFHLSLWTEQLSYFGPDSWIASAEKLGGGQLFSHGCHYIDLLLWYLGEPVSGTHLGTNLGTPWMEKEGTSDVCIRFASGALGYHHGTWGARGTRLGYSFHAHCTEGFLEADFFKGTLIARKGAQEDLLFQAPQGKNISNEVEHFLQCIQSGSQPVTNARDSLQGLRVIWRLYEAEEKGVVADLRGLGLKPRASQE